MPSLRSRITAACALLWLARAAAPSAAPTPGRPVLLPPSAAPAAAPAPAATAGRLLLFHDPGDGTAARMEAAALGEPEIAELARRLGLVRVDARAQRDRASRAGVTALPAFVVVRDDGSLSPPIPALLPSEMLRHSIETELFAAPAPADAGDAELRALLRRGEPLAADDWRRVLRGLAVPGRRRALLAEIQGRAEFPAATLVELLDDGALVVRVAALELLEERAGDTFGFDPWLGRGENGEARERWRAWARDAKPAELPLYAALTDDRLEALIQDLLGESPERSAHARRRLGLAGAGALPAIEARIAAWPDPADGRVHRLRELRYTLLLPDLKDRSAAALARQLVAGTLDEQLDALRAVGGARRGAEPVLRDFLEHELPRVREAAVESLLRAAKRNAVALLRDRLGRETNTDVRYAILSGLGRLNDAESTAALLAFAGHEREDLAIAALRGLGRRERTLSAPVVEAIRAALRDPRWRVRVTALEAAAERSMSALAAETEAALADPDEFVRHMAVRAVAAISRDAASVRARLERLFVEEDSLKAAIAEAYTRMRRRWPAAFGEALLRAGADAALPVIGAAGRESGAHDVMLALTGHRDGDVRCAAWGWIAQISAGEPDARRAMIRALREADRAEALAILQQLQLPDALRTMLAPPAAASAGAPAADGAPDDLMDAFFGGAAAPAPAAAPAAPAAPAAAPDDLMDAFFGAPGAGAAPSAGGSLGDLRDAVAAAATRWPGDAEIGRAARLARMTLCDVSAVAEIAQDFPGWPAGEQLAVAQRLPGFPPDTLGDLLPLLLRSSSARLRTETAEYLSEHAGMDGLRRLAEELARPDAALNPWDLALYRLNSIFERADARRAAPALAVPLLRHARAPVRVLGLRVLNAGWRRADTLPAVLDALDDEDPFVRRAAWHVLGWQEFRTFVQRIDAALDDPSEHVRAVVPSALTQFRIPLPLRFDAEHEGHLYESPSRRLDAGEQASAALGRLARDPVPAVRVRAYAALVALRKPFPVEGLVAALDACEAEDALDALRERMWDALAELGPEFAPLADFLSQGRRDEEDLARLAARFPAETPASAAAVLRRPGATVSFRPPEAAAGPAAASDAPLIRLVLFHDPGCSDCEDVERWLAPLVERWGSVRVDRHDIRTPDARRRNNVLCHRYGVPANLRGVAPAVFAARGALVGREINFETLAALMERSAGVPMTDTGDADAGGEADIAGPPAAATGPPRAGRRISVTGLALLVALPILLVGLGTILRRLRDRAG